MPWRAAVQGVTKVSPADWKSDWSELNWTDSSLAKAKSCGDMASGLKSVMLSKDEQLGKDLARKDSKYFDHHPICCSVFFDVVTSQEVS